MSKFVIPMIDLTKMENFTYIYNLLIIDKDPQTQALAESVLTMKSYVTRSATTIHEVKEVVNEWLPDLILLDLTNPELQGLSVLNQLHSDKKLRSIPVIVCVDIDTREMMGEALAKGAADSILKPLRKDEFLNRIQWFRQQKEQQIQIRKLQQKVEEKSVNYDSISKQMRSSIHSIRLMNSSLLHTLGKDRIEKDELDLLLDIYNETTELSLVWDNFQKSAHYNPDLCKPRKQRVDINSILCNIANSYLPVAQKKNVTIYKEGFDTELFADVDIEMFRSVVRNLISDAIYNNQPGGQVILSSYTLPEDQCVVKVQQSTQKGKSQEESSYKWDLCHSYAKAHNGKIWFDTKENQHTACYFSFIG